MREDLLTEKGGWELDSIRFMSLIWPYWLNNFGGAEPRTPILLNHITGLGLNYISQKIKLFELSSFGL